RRAAEATRQAGEDRRGAQTPSDGLPRAALPALRRRARPKRSHQAAVGVFGLTAGLTAPGLGVMALGDATRFVCTRVAGAHLSVSTPSSHVNASSSDRFFAYISSEARIFFAFTYICFSPVESPFSPSRSDRFLTTSASSKMSPVFILSRLCLKRRVNGFPIVQPPLVLGFITLLTPPSPPHLAAPPSAPLIPLV